MSKYCYLNNISPSPWPFVFPLCSYILSYLLNFPSSIFWKIKDYWILFVILYPLRMLFFFNNILFILIYYFFLIPNFIFISDDFFFTNNLLNIKENGFYLYTEVEQAKLSKDSLSQSELRECDPDDPTCVGCQKLGNDVLKYGVAAWVVIVVTAWLLGYFK
jgi:hypothetical protein